MKKNRLTVCDGASSNDPQRLRVAIENFGLTLLAAAKGPMLLSLFAERVAMHAGIRVLNNPEYLSDAIKELLWMQRHSRLRLVGPSMPGVGYIYDFDNPETWPVGVGHGVLK